ncbi:hypothetical protein F5141DRAFT_184885 [Pisolithus sp. B1]|nr:hypothetical protein F5141DRAFT_184885 [Pisolithus sp. B1]
MPCPHLQNIDEELPVQHSLFCDDLGPRLYSFTSSGVLFCAGSCMRVFSVCINALYPALDPAKHWASPYPHTCRNPTTSTSSLNPAYKTKAPCSENTRPPWTPEVHRQACQRVYHPDEMGGVGATEQAATSCPTNISPMEACISSIWAHAR